MSPHPRFVVGQHGATKRGAQISLRHRCSGTAAALQRHCSSTQLHCTGTAFALSLLPTYTRFLQSLQCCFPAAVLLSSSCPLRHSTTQQQPFQPTCNKHANRTHAGLVPIVLVAMMFGMLLLAWQQGRRCACGGSQQQQRLASIGGGATAVAVDASMAHMLLPLTNFSALTTAVLLDAHGKIGTEQARGLVRLHQELYCRCVCGLRG